MSRHDRKRHGRKLRKWRRKVYGRGSFFDRDPNPGKWTQQARFLAAARKHGSLLEGLFSPEAMSVLVESFEAPDIDFPF